MSVFWPQRNATVNSAKPSAEISAVRLPSNRPKDSASTTISAMPSTAKTVAIMVARRTGSRRIR